ncbi:EAD6 domain-containing conflict system protein, partial [Coleofasciculus sp.]
MSLTDRQKQKLRQDIEDVLSEDKLKNIVLENEGTFGNNFYNQLPGNDYRTRLIYAIKELENRGLFQEFVRQVGQEYPRVKANFTIYEQLSALIFILQEVTRGKQVEQFFDVHTVEELEEDLLRIIECDREFLDCVNRPGDRGLSTTCPSL